MTGPAMTNAPLRPLRRFEFERLKTYIHAVSGIQLAPSKRALLEGRLGKRLRALGLRSFGDYYNYLVGDDGSERQCMIDCVTTNETSFFREIAHFELLSGRIIPRWRSDAEAQRRKRNVRVLSAGCSTGEEAYSLGMCLSMGLPPSEGWRVEVIASDISMRVLEIASQGVYPIERSDGIPPAYLKRFMLRGAGDHAGQMKVGPELRSIVRFGRMNLNSDAVHFDEPFDLILCRNVLIYFDHAGKVSVVDRLIDCLAPAVC